jgi:glycosidase
MSRASEPSPARRVVYQLLPRLFGNTQRPARIGGTLAESGCGRFADLDVRALAALRELGVNTLWLTGVLEHATATSHPGIPADDPDIVKGSAGSPYAVRDLFDVAADLAQDPAQRLAEFRALVARCHAHGLQVWLDFVPNHVARSHASDVRPEHALGAEDDRSVFFARDNHFFYLQADHPGGGPPLKLPERGAFGCDGRFAPETEFGRVTGNNAATWAPSLDDWYETVKLNFGHDYTSGRDTSHLPGPGTAPEAVPRTWRTLDAVLEHWQALGVDGFRVDMAHLVPMEFWAWAIQRARARCAAVHFCAEAYDNDPAKLTDGNVLDTLLSAGFDAVYDDPLYDVLEGLYEDGKWCNDLDALVAPAAAELRSGRMSPAAVRFLRSLRYGENHDEVRLANPSTWGGLGLEVGRPVCAVLYALGPGPLLLYMGQEVGEAALGDQGFGGANARTSIFDYGDCPELARWFNGGCCDGALLSPEQRALRAWLQRLLALVRDPVFERGVTWPLNGENLAHEAFGRLPGEGASGHWLYAFARSFEGRVFVVAANFNATHALRNARVRLSAGLVDVFASGSTACAVHERLGGHSLRSVTVDEVRADGLALPVLAPLSAAFLELVPIASSSVGVSP